MVDVELAYLAGFFDGEGSISISRHGRGDRSLSLHLQVPQIVRAPLERFQARFGGTIHLTGRGQSPLSRRPIWSWHAGPRAGAAALGAMLPYLIVKRQQADIALEFQSRMKWGTNQPPSDEEWEIRLGLQARLREARVGSAA